MVVPVVIIHVRGLFIKIIIAPPPAPKDSIKALEEFEKVQVDLRQYI